MKSLFFFALVFTSILNTSAFAAEETASEIRTRLTGRDAPLVVHFPAIYQPFWGWGGGFPQFEGRLAAPLEPPASGSTIGNLSR